MSITRFFRRRYWDEERARELEAYLAQEIDDNLARGMRPQEARAAAHRNFFFNDTATTEIYTMNVDAQGVMRMREIDGVALAPKAKVQMKPGLGLHLMLIGLKEPLKEDATFPMTLEFERAGKVEVKVIVGQPKPGGTAAEGHMH